MKSTGRVIYAGIYSTVRIPREENPCVKVTFPCRGSANVYLRPVAHADGSFGLDSSGSGFGKSGFYRLVESGPEHWRVRNFTTLHELFRVYVDPQGVLRTDHKISFVWLTILRLHYKMTPLGKQKSRCPSRGTSSLRLSWNFSLRRMVRSNCQDANQEIGVPRGHLFVVRAV
jgi:hypothetical protein